MLLTPTGHKTASQQRNYLVQSDNGATMENPDGKKARRLNALGRGLLSFHKTGPSDDDTG